MEETDKEEPWISRNLGGLLWGIVAVTRRNPDKARRHAASLHTTMSSPRTYQLHVHLPQPLHLAVGHLGEFDFPAGRYAHTGSAMRHFAARIARHLRREKTLHWHIDYLLAALGATVTGVTRSAEAECALNQGVAGGIVVPGFGASDCKHGCGRHLKYLGC
jgi:Uri superfamily endonuclease